MPTQNARLSFESVLSEGLFANASSVKCAATFEGGTQVVYGTDDGVYLANQHNMEKAPVQIIAISNVTQLDVLKEYGIVIVLADKVVQTFLFDSLDPKEASIAGKRSHKVATNVSFFKTGVCLNKTLVCVVKSGILSSTMKTFEPIERNEREGNSIRKIVQGSDALLCMHKKFYIPGHINSVHFLKSKLCLGGANGFQIVDLDTLDTRDLLDEKDSSLDFVRKRLDVRPLAIYEEDEHFLLCYNEFAFYINKTGCRSRSDWLVKWKGHPTAFTLHHPYILAFHPNSVEVRDIESGALVQIISGPSTRLLCAESPSSTSPNAHTAEEHGIQQGARTSHPPVMLMATDVGVMTIRQTAT